MTIRASDEWGDRRSGPLAGVRVLDLSQQLPGPYATALLANLGANVVKVEPPAGDPARHVDPLMFEKLNRDKTIVTIDLKSAEGQLRIAGLLAEANVFIEGFRPGVVARLGVDPAVVLEKHPALLYCSLSGYGQSGPFAHQPAHDINVQAVAGALPLDGRLDSVGVAWVDLSAGTMLALSIVAAVHGGRSGYIEFSLLDTALAWADIKPYAVEAKEGAYGTVHSGDGVGFAIGLLEDSGWPRLCAALDWPDWERDGSYDLYEDRLRGAAEIRARLESSFAGLNASEVIGLAARHDLPIVPLDPTSPAALQQREVRRRVYDFTSPTVPQPGAVISARKDPVNRTGPEQTRK